MEGEEEEETVTCHRPKRSRCPGFATFLLPSDELPFQGLAQPNADVLKASPASVRAPQQDLKQPQGCVTTCHHLDSPRRGPKNGFFTCARSSKGAASSDPSIQSRFRSRVLAFADGRS